MREYLIPKNFLTYRLKILIDMFNFRTTHSKNDFTSGCITITTYHFTNKIGVVFMPIEDVEKREIVKKALLDVAICRKCFARNSKNATNCRRCGTTRLRAKRKERAG